MNEKVQIYLAILISTVYCYLVIQRIASVEGFVALSTYIIKKFLDHVTVQNGGDKQ